MINDALIASLIAAIGNENVRINESMAEHTTFKTGGLARLLLLPRSEEHLLACLHRLKTASVPYVVIGRGSNLLVSDSGFSGAVIKLSDGFDALTLEGNRIIAQAGVSLRALCMKAIHSGLSGLEFAGGIPGNVGGGILMNAGAYGGELKDCTVCVDVLTVDLERRRIPSTQMEFGYRTSIAQKNGYIILGAQFCLQPGNPNELLARMNELNARRRDKQPLQYPSAGSTFRRPAGHFAGQLIEQCGLKGFSIGGAQVSEKHAGFIINTGHATSRDIYNLICFIQRQVFEKTGVTLEPEVKLLGNFL